MGIFKNEIWNGRLNRVVRGCLPHTASAFRPRSVPQSIKNKFGYTFKEVQRHLDNLPKIMLEKEEEIVGIDSCAYSFIKNFFSIYNPERNTLYAGGGIFFWLKGRFLFRKHRRRSIKDIYRLCHRYTNASLEDTYLALKMVYLEDYKQKKFHLTSSICSEINRRVWSTIDGYGNGFFAAYHDEYGFDMELTTKGLGTDNDHFEKYIHFKRL